MKNLEKQLLKTNLYPVFRIIDNLDSEHYDEFRKAVLEKNIHAIFRVIISILIIMKDAVT